MSDGLSYKQIEGQRIQQVLGAIGALPAAMLVFADNPLTAAPGAPLFAMAIALVVGALMHWNYTDAAYDLDGTEHRVLPQHQDEVEAWIVNLHNASSRFQDRTYAYGISSIMCSIMGVAAVFSTLRTPIGVNTGFVAVVIAAALVCYEIYQSGQQRNRLVEECRRLSELPGPSSIC